MPDQLEIVEEIIELLYDNDYHNFDYVMFTY